MLPVFPADHRTASMSESHQLSAGANVQPPQVAVEQRILMLWGERGHTEPDQLAVIVDQPGPCNIGHSVGTGQRPGDRATEDSPPAAVHQLIEALAGD